ARDPRAGDRRGDDPLRRPGARGPRLGGPRDGDVVARDPQARAGPAARRPRLV
ncbi:MAG: Pyridoxal 5'-phosphate synthase (glutamine hydrolyzing), synthase subunit, partial [uncultured Solirubrobacteraceae bacterium]